MDLEFVSLRGKLIEEYLEQIAVLRLEALQEFPYLYEGKINFEKDFLKTYSESSNSLIEIVKDENEVVGVTSCIPLSEESDEMQRMYTNQGYDVRRIFFFGESLILPKYRSEDIYREFFKRMEEHIIDVQPTSEFAVFGSIKRSKNHSLYNEEYKKLTDFWTTLGFKEDRKLFLEFKWKDINKKSESVKKMVFWKKPIRPSE